jgi:hypothetical protein
MNAGEMDIIRVEHNLAFLPPHEEVPRHPTKSFGEIPGNEFVEMIDNIYDEIVQWRKNLFKLPSGKSSKIFITELTTWIDHFNKNTEYQCIALKVFMILPNLILQKPSKNSKAKEHARKVKERMTAWKEGRFMENLFECRLIQRRLQSNKRPAIKDKSRTFAKLMFQGKVNAALKMLKDESDTGVHEVSIDVIKALREKHPPSAPIRDNTLLFGPIEYLSPNYFDELDENMILKAAQRTKGAGGPSHVDAEQFSHILTSTKYKKENKELREQISIMAKKLATEIVDPKTLESYIASRLIPLNKNPGVRPIGVGEVLRRIIGKAVGWILKKDIQEAAGPLQAATGLQGGAEAAIHAMKSIFEQDDTEGVILVDASNAFNSLNRKAALHNVQIICPNFATILINTYREPSRMVVFGADDIMSVEGTTQGDNLAMSFYALGTDPLMRYLKITCPNTRQVSLADDITGAGTIYNLKEWWDTIVVEGQKFGYYVNESKSWLILKDETLLNTAKNVFCNSAIKFTTEGKRHLGAVLGSDNFRKQYTEEKVSEWCAEVEKLSEYAKSQPQAAFSAFIHGEIHKFTYFMRTIPEMETYLEQLDDVITNRFIPTLFESLITEQDRKLFSLPIRFGGLGIPYLIEKAQEHYSASQKMTASLVAIIVMQGNCLPDELESRDKYLEMKKETDITLQAKSNTIEKDLPDEVLRAVKEAKEKGASSWLAVLPLEEYGFTLNKGEFRDALNLRYGKNLRGLPSKCPCGHAYNVNHALNCKKGGFVTNRHNAVRDFEATLLNKVLNDVEIEPPLQPLNGEIIEGLAGDNARLDVRARSFWRQGQNAYFDVRVTNTNADSQKHLSTKKILDKHEKEKKRHYNHRVMNIEHGTFTPLVFSVNGSIGAECLKFHKHLADMISLKNGERYERILSIIRCKLSFLILKSSLMCIRGSRSYNKCNTNFDDFEIACNVTRCSM